MRGSCGAACRRTVAPPSIDARPLNQLRPCVSIYSAKSFLSGAASARPRASRSHQFSGDRRRNKLFPDDGKCCIQRYVLQSLACPAKSGLAPSCVYRSDTSAARHWTTNYASPHQGKNDIHFIIWRSVRYTTCVQILVCPTAVSRNHGRLPEFAYWAILNSWPARSRPERPLSLGPRPYTRTTGRSPERK